MRPAVRRRPRLRQATQPLAGYVERDNETGLRGLGQARTGKGKCCEHRMSSDIRFQWTRKSRGAQYESRGLESGLNQGLCAAHSMMLAPMPINRPCVKISSFFVTRPHGTFFGEPAQARTRKFTYPDSGAFRIFFWSGRTLVGKDFSARDQEIKYHLEALAGKPSIGRVCGVSPTGLISFWASRMPGADQQSCPGQPIRR